MLKISAVLSLLLLLVLGGCAARERAESPEIISQPAPGEAETGTAEARRTEPTTAPEAGIEAKAPQVRFTAEQDTVPAGTQIIWRLNNRIGSEINKSGDQFTGTIDQDLVGEKGKLVAPKGSLVRGTLIEVIPSGRVRGRAEMTLVLNEIIVGDRTYPITSNRLIIRAEPSIKEDIGTIGIGTGAGTIIGLILGGGSGAAKGAAVGAAAGTAVVFTTKGNKLEFDPEQKFAHTIQEPVLMQVVEVEEGATR